MLNFEIVTFFSHVQLLESVVCSILDALEDAEAVPDMCYHVYGSPVLQVRYVLDMCQVRVRYVSYMCQIRVRYVSGTCQIRVIYVSDACQICVRYVSDAVRRCVVRLDTVS